MRALALLALLMGAAPAPTEADRVYYNARLALREGQAELALKLWLLRNTMEEASGRVSAHDADFASVTWAALGALGLCQDGHPKDAEGAGLWPLALHNSLVRNLGRRAPPPSLRPFTSFEVDRQARTLTISDSPGSAELATVRFSRTRCLGPRLAALRAGELPTARLSDRQVAARVILSLLTRARDTLAPGRVRGLAALEARRFDVLLKQAELAERQARQETSAAAARARQLGLSREAVEALRAAAARTRLDPASEAAAILAASAGWSVDEWMSLSAERRLFLFDHARSGGAPAEDLQAIALGVLDRLIAAGDGEGVSAWIPRVDDPAQIWSGRRGRALLAVDEGFDERAVIALHLGVEGLGRGEVRQALADLALAVQRAPGSSVEDEVHALALRWLAYASARYVLDEELLATLQALVPRRDLSLLVEDMLWRAAFRADAASFDTGRASLGGRGAAQRRLDGLEPLARGDVGAFLRGVRAALAESPGETLRFLDQLVERLEAEDAEVRAAQLPTLRGLRALLQSATLEDSQGRAAEALLDRSLAIIEGLEGLDALDAPQDRARALAPGAEVFAGSLRLAPSDPLPWPFKAREVSAPSVFTPLTLRPVEWQDPEGAWVFGWEIEG